MAIRYLDETAYRAYLEKRCSEPGEAEARWGNVEQVINALAASEQENPDGTLSDFLARLSLSTREFYDPKDYQMARDAVVLMTLHSAKGLEFREVYMVGMEEGVLPHRRAVEEDAKGIDEERRLCYVGITRAQERLTFTFALTRRKWGKPRSTQPSRFLFELAGLADCPQKARTTT
jgi:DNA helicase-2/ATP-dependent DNA helicase PcrA